MANQRHTRRVLKSVTGLMLSAYSAFSQDHVLRWTPGTPYSGHTWTQGLEYRGLHTDSVDVAAAQYFQGGGIAFVVWVQNLGTAYVDVLPKAFELQVLTPKAISLRPIPAGKTVTRSKWSVVAAAAAGAGAGIQDANGTTTTGTISNSDGSSSQVTLRTRNQGSETARIREQAAQGQQQRDAKRSQIESGELRAQTLTKTAQIGGSVWFPKVKATTVILRMPVNGIVYEIPFELAGK